MSYAAAQDDDDDRYYTQVEAGDVRLFSLDQLDAAFNAGLIHENTYVCLEGDTKWLTLAEVAGLGDEEPEPPPPPAPVARYTPPAQTYASRPPNIVPAPYSVAPVIVPPSIAPVTNDLSFDDFDPDMMAMRPKRRAGKVVAGLAVLALGGLGFAVVSSGMSLPRVPFLNNASSQAASLSLSKLSEPAAAAKAPVVEAPKVEAAKPEPPKAEETTKLASAEASPAGDTSTSKAKEGDRFSEEMKEALLKKDEKAASGQKAKKKARLAAPAKRAKAGKASAGFKAGGSSYDPLNGKL